jgi:hypothetical protein
MSPKRPPYTASEDGAYASPLRFGFRRRCAWCGVVLRGWQLNLCRLCKRPATGDAGVYLQGGGPPCPPASRWEAEPDHWRRPSTNGESSEVRDA